MLPAVQHRENTIHFGRCRDSNEIAFRCTSYIRSTGRTSDLPLCYFLLCCLVWLRWRYLSVCMFVCLISGDHPCGLIMVLVVVHRLIDSFKTRLFLLPLITNETKEGKGNRLFIRCRVITNVSLSIADLNIGVIVISLAILVELVVPSSSSFQFRWHITDSMSSIVSFSTLSEILSEIFSSNFTTFSPGTFLPCVSSKKWRLMQVKERRERDVCLAHSEMVMMDFSSLTTEWFSELCQRRDLVQTTLLPTYSCTEENVTVEFSLSSTSHPAEGFASNCFLERCNDQSSFLVVQRGRLASTIARYSTPVCVPLLFFVPFYKCVTTLWFFVYHPVELAFHPLSPICVHWLVSESSSSGISFTNILAASAPLVPDTTSQTSSGTSSTTKGTRDAHTLRYTTDENWFVFFFYEQCALTYSYIQVS